MEYKINDLISYDIGPGNCLLDELVRKKTKKSIKEKFPFPDRLVERKGKTKIPKNTQGAHSTHTGHGISRQRCVQLPHKATEAETEYLSLAWSPLIPTAL